MAAYLRRLVILADLLTRLSLFFYNHAPNSRHCLLLSPLPNHTPFPNSPLTLQDDTSNISPDWLDNEIVLLSLDDQFKIIEK
jgi:hypothetical protein